MKTSSPQDTTRRRIWWRHWKGFFSVMVVVISFYCSQNCRNIVKAKPFNILFTARMKINLLSPSVTSSFIQTNHGRSALLLFFLTFMAYICTSAHITQIIHPTIKDPFSMRFIVNTAHSEGNDSLYKIFISYDCSPFSTLNLVRNTRFMTVQHQGKTGNFALVKNLNCSRMTWIC